VARDAEDFPADEHLRVYGSEAALVSKLADQQPHLAAKLHEHLPYRGAEVVWAVRHEMARKLEDVLARRTRALVLDARASIAAAQPAAALMAAELGRDGTWINREIAEYQQLAAGYVLNS
jgi:glycerol-3-phosphate dehydrogenase